MLTTQLQFAGVLLIGVGLLNGILPRRYDWKGELPRLGVFNRQMFVVQAIFIAVTCLLMGLLLISSARELIETPLGRRIMLGYALFWTLRLLTQLFGYSSEVWKGKRLETAAHFGFTAVWVYLSALFWWVAV